VLASSPVDGGVPAHGDPPRVAVSRLGVPGMGETCLCRSDNFDAIATDFCIPARLVGGQQQLQQRVRSTRLWHGEQDRTVCCRQNNVVIMNEACDVSETHCRFAGESLRGWVAPDLAVEKNDVSPVGRHAGHEASERPEAWAPLRTHSLLRHRVEILRAGPGPGCILCHVRLAYQPPANSTFLSEQTSHQQPASSMFLSKQTSTSHQPPAKRTDC
jgi:hypothetical protein